MNTLYEKLNINKSNVLMHIKYRNVEGFIILDVVTSNDGIKTLEPNGYIIDGEFMQYDSSEDTNLYFILNDGKAPIFAYDLGIILTLNKEELESEGFKTINISDISQNMIKNNGFVEIK